MSPEKGHFLLLEAARKLMSEGLDFQLVLAGDGQLRGQIETAIDEMGLRARTRVTGWLSTAEVRQEILASRVLVVPSFAEGLPVVIMEAMALERPVISTCIAGIPELVNTGAHGWLVTAGDVDGMASAMKQCLNTAPAELGKMGKAAKEQVIRHHDVDHEAGKLIELFRNVVEARHAGSETRCRNI
jgi:glycosyltransferase involved in cell wall biosynthesis